jgi:hypothetical protein
MPKTVGDLKREIRGLPDTLEIEIRVPVPGVGLVEYNVGVMFDNGAEFVIVADPEDTDAYVS